MRQAGPKFKTTDEVDFVIVGSGAAGGVLAKELSTNGFRVVVLEQGPYLTPDQLDHDDLHVFFENALTNKPQLQPTTFRKTPQSKANPQPAVMYGRCVGGSSVHFTANYWRFHEIDFIERSKRGPVAGTGFADWPITYADLEPYYTKVEWEVGVSGLACASPFDPPRSKPYAYPPLPVKSGGVIFERAARKLGWHPFPAPMAILSKPAAGRGACVHCGYCLGFGCEVGAKSSSLVTVIPIAERTGRCEIRADSNVFRIETNERGRVTGVAYFDSQKRQQFQKAKVVVVSANGAETPRLLLLSASKLFPNGLANSSGLVGKYLMPNSFLEVFGVYEHPLNDYKGAAVSRILHDFYEAGAQNGYCGGGGLDSRLAVTPVGFGLGGLPSDAPTWGSAYKSLLREYFTRTMDVTAHGTSLPVETNSFSLDPDLKDAWGLPALRVTYTDHPDDLKNTAFLMARALEIHQAAGARKTWHQPIQETQFFVHLLGTCRMGNDSKTSVINADHRAHDVPNLFLCDGSSFVTSGRGQPTMTIQALAYRAADRITALAKRGDLSV